eukprot:GHVH01008750.1.p1 GENE.GHVH01008750.1~~GHVH01008750.1.p1  ORF type:complete len:417 (+),score=109.70 GHVH01008750.1:160-1410(+)
MSILKLLLLVGFSNAIGILGLGKQAEQHSDERKKMRIEEEQEQMRIDHENEMMEAQAEYLDSFTADMEANMETHRVQQESIMDKSAEYQQRAGVAQADGEYQDIKNKMESDTILINNQAEIQDENNDARQEYQESVDALYNDYFVDKKNMDDELQEYMMNNQEAAQEALTEMDMKSNQMLMDEQAAFEADSKAMVKYMENRRVEYEAAADEQVDEYYQDGLDKFEASLDDYNARKEEIQNLWNEEMDKQEDYAMWYSEALKEQQKEMNDIASERRQQEMDFANAQMANDQALAEAGSASSDEMINNMVEYQNARYQSDNELKMKQAELDSQVQMASMQAEKQSDLVNSVGLIGSSSGGSALQQQRASVPLNQSRGSSRMSYQEYSGATGQRSDAVDHGVSSLKWPSRILVMAFLLI